MNSNPGINVSTTNPAIGRLLSDPAKEADVAKAHLLLGLEAEDRLDWGNAVEHYLRVVELVPADSMVRYFGHNNLAYSLLQLRRFNEAEMHAVAAIEIDAERHNAFKNLGLACEGLGRPADAADCFIGASLRNMTDKRAWLHLQQLLANNPDLLSQRADLAEHIEGIRDNYESHGGVPALN